MARSRDFSEELRRGLPAENAVEIPTELATEEDDVAQLQLPPEDTGDIIASERRARMTRDLDPEIAASFTDEELEKIELDSKKKAFEAKRKKALEEIMALADMEARVEQGLIPPEMLRDEATRARLAEQVKIKVNLPLGGGALGFRVDGRLFREGETHTVSRAVYESLLEMHFRMHKAELEFSTLNASYRNGTAVSQIMTRSPPSFRVIE